MKTTINFSIILAFILVGNLYSTLPAPPTNYYNSGTTAPNTDSICCEQLLLYFTPQEFFNSFPNQINVKEFCEKFPCMCCQCGNDVSVKLDGVPCPDETLYKKVCCFGKSNQQILS